MFIWLLKKNLTLIILFLLTLEFLGPIVHKSNTEKRRNQSRNNRLKKKNILKNENFVVAERGPEEQVGGTGGEGREESS